MEAVVAAGTLSDVIVKHAMKRTELELEEDVEAFCTVNMTRTSLANEADTHSMNPDRSWGQ